MTIFDEPRPGGWSWSTSPRAATYAKRAAIGTIAAVAVTGLILAVVSVAGFPGIATNVWILFRNSFIWVIAGTILLPVLWAAREAIVGHGRWTKAAWAVTAVVGLLIVGGFMSLIGIGSSVGVGTIFSHLNAQTFQQAETYAANITEVEQDRPEYSERTAFDQAQFTIARSLGGRVGDLSEPTRIDGQRWCSYLTSASSNRNRWVETVICLDDNGDITTADFPADTVPSFEGFRRSNIANAVTSIAGIGNEASRVDAYAYIGGPDGNLARFVAPVQQVNGTDFFNTFMPNGAVVYENSPENGVEVNHWQDIEQGELDGPVVGAETVARRVLNSVNSQQGFLVWKRPLRSQESLQPTSRAGRVSQQPVDGEPVEESSDPNASNPTGFILERDGRLFSVTPLTSFGSSATITAYLEVAVDVNNGETPEATLYRLPEPQAANATISNAIRTIYQADLSEADRIFEITPAGQDQSIVTIGREDQERFIARSSTAVSNGRATGEICVTSRTGNLLDCAPLTGDPRPLGTLVPGSADTTNDSPLDDSGPRPEGIEGFTTEELLEELARRIPQ